MKDQSNFPSTTSKDVSHLQIIAVPVVWRTWAVDVLRNEFRLVNEHTAGLGDGAIAFVCRPILCQIKVFVVVDAAT